MSPPNAKGARMFPNWKQPEGPPATQGTVGHTRNRRPPSSEGATAHGSTDRSHRRRSTRSRNVRRAAWFRGPRCQPACESREEGGRPRRALGCRKCHVSPLLVTWERRKVIGPPTCVLREVCSNVWEIALTRPRPSSWTADSLGSTSFPGPAPGSCRHLTWASPLES